MTTRPHPPCITAREHERDLRRRYQGAIAAAIESLQRAEQRFEESSSAIDAHIKEALAAAVLRTASVMSFFGLERTNADVVAAAPLPPKETSA